MTRRRSSKSAAAAAPPTPLPVRTRPAASGVWFLALLCGIAALIYEIVWSRYLALVFGVSAYAVATVLAAFMLGLALGNWHVGRRLDHSSSGQTVFSRLCPRTGLPRRGTSAGGIFLTLQCALACYIAASPWIYRLLLHVTQWTIHALSGDSSTGWRADTLRFTLALAVLLPPTYCIGGTFPALIHWAASKSGESPHTVAWVYAFNTLGGVLGALLAGFVLIPYAGMSVSLWLAAGITLLASAALWWIESRRKVASPPSVSREDAPALTAADPPIPPHLRRLALALCAISGLAALAYQVLWTRILTLFFRDTVYDFTIVLAVFLAGIVLGSLACRRLLSRGVGTAHALGWVQLALGAAVLLGLHLVAQLPYLLNDLQTNKSVVEHYGTGYWPAALAIRLGYALLLMLPPTCLFGAAFPLAARLWMAPAPPAPLAPPPFPDPTPNPAPGIGLLTAVNGLGATAGAILAGFLIVPLLGLQHSIMLLAALNILAGMALLGALWQKNRGFLLAITAAAALLLIVSVPAWDKLRMSTGFLDQNQPLDELLELRFYQEDAAGITIVVNLIPFHQKFLVTNRVYSQNTSDLGGLQDHRRLGLIPMLLHPQPRQVLAVGLGAGITLRGIMDLAPQNATVVELLPGVVQAAAEFAPENNRVLDNPAVHVVVQDGRNCLAATGGRFDVIVLDILHPMSSGSSSVFSREYYTLCRDHLAPGGIVCQWLPVHQLSADELKTIMRTFQAVFPHTTVWYGLLGDSTQVVGLVGTEQPLALDAADLAARYASADAALRQELKEVNLGTPALLLSHVIMGESATARFCAGAALDTDDRPVIEFAAPRLAVTAARQGMLNMVALTDAAEPLAAALPAAALPSGTIDAPALARCVAAKRALIQGFRLELAANPAAREEYYRQALEQDPANEDLRDITRKQ